MFVNELVNPFSFRERCKNAFMQKKPRHILNQGEPPVFLPLFYIEYLVLQV